MYTIQIDGQTRQEAEAYDIYDAFWEIQLVNKNQLKPTPTRILTQIDSESEDEGGIFCNKCGDNIVRGKIYHCPNKSHDEEYDLCLKCSKKLSKLPPKLSSYNLKGLAEFILSNKCQKIGILCGAGIYRSAGVCILFLYRIFLDL